MKLYKKDILKILKQYDLDSQECIIISGASLVLQDVKEYTHDIDITVSHKLYKELLNKHNCKFDKKINNYDIWFIDNIINFSTNYYNEIESIKISNYRVQSIDSVLKLKQKLNREKDHKDIQLILNINKKSSSL